MTRPSCQCKEFAIKIPISYWRRKIEPRPKGVNNFVPVKFLLKKSKMIVSMFKKGNACLKAITS